MTLNTGLMDSEQVICNRCGQPHMGLHIPEGDIMRVTENGYVSGQCGYCGNGYDNFRITTREESLSYPDDSDLPMIVWPISEPNSYGTCDYPEQLAEKYPRFKGVKYFTRFSRAEEPERYGWRWHRRGVYIGNYDIRHIEYIFEADGVDGRPLIDHQYVFDEGTGYIDQPLIPIRFNGDGTCSRVEIDQTTKLEELVLR